MSDIVPFFNLWFTEALGDPMFRYQENLVRILVDEGRPVIINKSRQTGISTLTAALAVQAAVFEAKKVLICSNKEDNAAHILEYAEVFFRALRRFPLKLPAVKKDQNTKLIFDTGGEIRCFAANPSTARGYPAHRIFFDEFAHFKGEANLDKKMLEAVAPSISNLGGMLVILSTPNGMTNEFARLWHSPDTPKDAKFTIHYTDCPRLKVREEVLAYGKRYWIEGMPTPFPEASFRQEFCNAFDPGSGSAIPTDAIWAKREDGSLANVVNDGEAWD